MKTIPKELLQILKDFTERLDVDCDPLQIAMVAGEICDFFESLDAIKQSSKKWRER